jgi:hypothetical protein
MLRASVVTPFFFSLYIFETRSHCVAQADLELTILLSRTSECWGYRCVHHARLHCSLLLSVIPCKIMTLFSFFLWLMKIGSTASSLGLLWMFIGP